MTLTFPHLEGGAAVHLAMLKAICGQTEGKSMIDLCCGHAPFTSKLGFSKRRYVDIKNRKLDDVGEQQFWTHGDALTADGAYDVSICLDGIEHFTLDAGYDLLSNMRRISEKQILFTPLGECGSITTTPGDPDTHKSAWYPRMVRMWAKIVIPNYHPTLKCGAFYFFNCSNLDDEWTRVSYGLIEQFKSKGYELSS